MYTARWIRRRNRRFIFAVLLGLAATILFFASSVCGLVGDQHHAAQFSALGASAGAMAVRSTVLYLWKGGRR